MSDPSEDWGYKLDATPELENREVSLDTDESCMSRTQLESNKEQKDLSFPSVPSLSEEDDELTESKIRAFLDEKVLLFSLNQVSLSAIKFSSIHDDDDDE